MHLMHESSINIDGQYRYRASRRLIGAFALSLVFVVACTPSSLEDVESVSTELNSTMPEPTVNPLRVGIGGGYEMCLPLHESAVQEDYFAADGLLGVNHINLENLFPLEGSETLPLQAAVRIIDAAIPGATPREFAQNYVSLRNPRLGDSLVIELNDNLSFESWPSEDFETEYSEVRSAKVRLLRSLERIIAAVEKYNPEFYDILGLRTIRISDEEGLQAGHYDHTEETISIEADLDSRALDSVIAHEVGHRMHALKCELHHIIPEDIEFYGDISGIKSQEEIGEFYTQVNSAYTSYDPNRRYPEAYAATQAVEYVASTIEHSLVIRGRILEGDADFGSVYQQVQSEMIAELDGRFPGFSAFIDTITPVLRTNPANEIYDNLEQRTLDVSSLREQLISLDPGQTLTMNGALGVRSANILRNYFINPTIEYDYHDDTITMKGTLAGADNERSTAMTAGINMVPGIGLVLFTNTADGQSLFTTAYNGEASVVSGEGLDGANVNHDNPEVVDYISQFGPPVELFLTE